VCLQGVVIDGYQSLGVSDWAVIKLFFVCIILSSSLASQYILQTGFPLFKAKLLMKMLLMSWGNFIVSDPPYSQRPVAALSTCGLVGCKSIYFVPKLNVWVAFLVVESPCF
jgi:hypothetical protein